jgi:hypothetical protein
MNIDRFNTSPVNCLPTQRTIIICSCSTPGVSLASRHFLDYIYAGVSGNSDVTQDAIVNVTLLPSSSSLCNYTKLLLSILT